MRKEVELYIHIPFCIRKCAYCDFLSAPASEETQTAYIEQLIREIQGFDSAKDYTVSTVFFGGGTPSVLSGSQIRDVMDAIRARFPYWISREKEGRMPEITIECNPGTLTYDKLAAYRRAGINRLSIGLQSARDEELETLGRIHTWQQFLESFLLARKMGFTNINIDLMSALPGQSLESFCDTLHKVCTLMPEHLSVYSLMIEEGTPFFELYGQDDRKRKAGEKPDELPDEETERQMYEAARHIPAMYGYSRYEISNYAREGYMCRHNMGYWLRTDYIGFGLGASSLQDPVRYKNTAILEDYLNGDFSKQEFVVLTKDNRIEETMFLGLRLAQGVDIRKFRKTFGCTVWQVYGKQIRQLEEKGLLEIQDGYIRLTSKGIDISNQVLAEFLL